MKKIFWLYLTIVGLPIFSQAQVIVNNQDINKNEDIRYIELIIDQRLFGQGEVFAVIDYGQVIRLGNLRQNRIKDAQGQDRPFGSEMDIFNFLYKNGWRHETTYAVGKEGYIHHIFQRKEASTVNQD
jgi:hypothetical protein